MVGETPFRPQTAGVSETAPAHIDLTAGDPKVFLTPEEEIAFLQQENSRLRAQLESTRAMAKDFGHMLVEESAENKDLEEKLLTAKDTAERDAKTGLYTPTVFESKVREIIARERRAVSHGLILGDLDNFRALNDLLGYLGNDEHCLIPSARIMQKSVRGQDLVCRFGGEEFAIFLRDVDLVTASEIAVRIRRDINDIRLPAEINGRDYLGISMGVVRFPAGAAYDKVFHHANRLLVMAKRSGRNQIIPEEPIAKSA